MSDEEWTKLYRAKREAEEAYESYRELPVIATITLRHMGESIGFIDIFPGEGNAGVVLQDSDATKEILETVVNTLKNMLEDEDNGNY